MQRQVNRGAKKTKFSSVYIEEEEEEEKKKN